MKRNENLIELSRDHHYGLLLGWKIRRGIENRTDLEVIRQYVAYFSQNSLFPHFKEEEQGVLSFMPEGDSHRQKVLQDHENIRTTVRAIIASDVVDAQDLLDLASMVDAHIRYEERQLFPYLEQSLSSEALAEIGTAIQASHKPFVESFENEFWQKPVDK